MVADSKILKKIFKCRSMVEAWESHNSRDVTVEGYKQNGVKTILAVLAMTGAGKSPFRLLWMAF